MVRFLVLALVAFALTSCKTGQAVTVDNETLSANECGSPHVQRLITYCASPQAADLAARNADLMGAEKADGDVPYSPVPIGDSPVRGPDDAPVTVVMFTDLECPYCRELHDNLTALQKEAPSDVRIVFKHTPLSFHPFAVPAALGALAAREQGKFWEYVDRVYENQESLDEDAILAHAAELGLDLEQFRNDFGSAPHVASVEADLALASQAGVQGTPTMFVNGVRVVGLHPIEDIRALLGQQKDLVTRLVEAGVRSDDLYWRLVTVQYDPAPPSNINDAPQEEEPSTLVAHVPTGQAPVKGAPADDALVTIVTFSDFQCPYCAAAVPPIDQLVQANEKDTRLAFRHFPLGNHPQAGPAALASIVAQEAGKFWAYHDVLFANQEDLSNDALMAYGEKIGLKAADIEKAMKDAERQARVIADQKLGIELGVQGTPTFFINGIMMMGVESPEVLQAIVDEQRALAQKVAQETGLKGEELYAEVVKRNQAAQ